ncbi:MAG: tRNA (adenosine(37)-N6)-threonylcarbamoyltransferase complex dimerization subunit type 1 TsaB [Omnitrophica bacterium]|nr:tRNA (adenosine(37)-N6)-threonylcarbamoyltransferase complex dimerization subunit type 1 TsaB [Candidatus Omnitrophota bacterium]
MNILAIDASTENISLCIMKEGQVAADYNRRMQFGATKLIGYIKKNLEKIALSLSDFDAFVIGSGPGSFTGLRISFSIIKAFMLATKKPVIAVSSFFSCAYPFRNAQRRIAVISDARKGLIYAACFKPKNNTLQSNGKEYLVKLEDIIRQKRNHLFITHNSHLRKQALERDGNIDFYPKDVYPKARYLLLPAKVHYKNRKFISVEKLEPLYLHPKTCQIRNKLKEL